MTVSVRVRVRVRLTLLFRAAARGPHRIRPVATRRVAEARGLRVRRRSAHGRRHVIVEASWVVPSVEDHGMVPAGPRAHLVRVRGRARDRARARVGVRGRVRLRVRLRVSMVPGAGLRAHRLVDILAQPLPERHVAAVGVVAVRAAQRTEGLIHTWLG